MEIKQDCNSIKQVQPKLSQIIDDFEMQNNDLCITDFQQQAIQSKKELESPTRLRTSNKQMRNLLKERLGINNVEDIVIQQSTPDYPEICFKEIYLFQEVIGSGAFGVVFQVEKIRNINPTSKCVDSKPISQLAAVKVINKNTLKDDGYRVLKNEALILRTMDHPNIVKFYEIYETSDFVFIEMEVIKGGTLSDFIKSKFQFSDQDASLIIKSILSAVEHVHSKNFVHRDLKPDNILISDQNDLSTIKVADFGLSESLRINIAYSLNEKMGTLLYMAPEQTKNHAYGKRIDVWACGIIMYILIEGRHPLFDPQHDNERTFLAKLKNPSWMFGVNFTMMAKDFFLKMYKKMKIKLVKMDQFQMRTINKGQVRYPLQMNQEIPQGKGGEPNERNSTQVLSETGQSEADMQEESISPKLRPQLLFSNRQSTLDESPPIRVKSTKRYSNRNPSMLNKNKNNYSMSPANMNGQRRSEMKQNNLISPKQFDSQILSENSILPKQKDSILKQIEHYKTDKTDSPLTLEIKDSPVKTLDAIDLDKGFSKNKIEKILDAIQSPKKSSFHQARRITTNINLQQCQYKIEDGNQSFQELSNAEQFSRQISRQDKPLSPNFGVKNMLRTSQKKFSNDLFQLPIINNENSEVQNITNRRGIPSEDWQKIIDGPVKRKSQLKAYATSSINPDDKSTNFQPQLQLVYDTTKTQQQASFAGYNKFQQRFMSWKEKKSANEKSQNTTIDSKINTGYHSRQPSSHSTRQPINYKRFKNQQQSAQYLINVEGHDNIIDDSSGSSQKKVLPQTTKMRNFSDSHNGQAKCQKFQRFEVQFQGLVAGALEDHSKYQQQLEQSQWPVIKEQQQYDGKEVEPFIDKLYDKKQTCKKSNGCLGLEQDQQ
ncbi:protein kinase domain containing protein [Stylonychia lemnae]|uniref:Protein kinase domain containing protein n=1 Tax=Stylonychia lemnae TaxID=5949 RepID=A0A078A0W7_STYLE|nr:protein kinase domain containing protein [Stylonychia lemnae]|eukprot:CDW74434.1 protein kinase domain containing protein [Stylonychia lemnae]